MPGEYLFTDGLGIRHSLEITSDNKVLLHATQPNDAILERNKAMALHNDGYTPSREMRRVATIPANIRMLWLQEEGWDAYRPDLYADKLMEKLNSAEWEYLRTAPGRVGVSNGVMR